MITGYKGFSSNLQCRGFQYEVGHTYATQETPVRCTANGFHFCENPLDVFKYYPPATSRYGVVEGEGEVDRKDADDSKVAVSKLTIGAEINIHGLVQAGVKFILDRVKDEGNAVEHRAQSAATNTGNWSAATNTGDQSAATNTGDQSAATNTGNQSAATNTGNQSAATNTGNWSAATNTGNWSAATNTGNWSAASVEGEESIAVATGYHSQAKGALGCWIVLAEWDATTTHIQDVQCVKVDGARVKADTWYQLIGGQFVEAK